MPYARQGHFVYNLDSLYFFSTDFLQVEVSDA